MRRFLQAISSAMKVALLFGFGVLICAFYLHMQNAPLKRITPDDISYMELEGSEISYQIDLYSSLTGRLVGSITGTVYFDARLNFDLFYVPCEKEIGDLCEDPVHVFWARYIHKKSPIPIVSTQYFTEDGRRHMPPDHLFFKKLKRKVLQHFCKGTEFCLRKEYDGLGLKIPYFDFN
tara:strand:- start:1553 stop:2083 length:531 start_codon:yes stop_codon:yes gene_type:complete